MKTESSFIPPAQVKISCTFWSSFMERVRTQVIPYQWEALNDRVSGAEPSYCIRNFKLAAELTHPELDLGVPADTGFGGFVFQDSDLAKWLEAVAYTLIWHPDPALEQTADEAIELVCAAQQEDGYLNTYYIINGLDKRFTNLQDNHEFYCFGHFTEAAVAYYEATGKRCLLDAVSAYADCLIRHFGREEGKLRGYGGHEIAEMALARLHTATGDQRYLDFMRYLIEERGQDPLYFEKEGAEAGRDFYWKESYFQYRYYQAGMPVRSQERAEGHAVRAVYLYSGMADLARLTDDQSLFAVCKDLWNNIVYRQLYITGGIGQSAYGESFLYDYALPNDTAYAETCASIGLVFFARRMAEIEAQSIYADVIEKALYNGILSGMSLDGKSFFYVNPLEALPEASLKDWNMRHVRVQRQKWFVCACCPPNIARLISSLGGYIYSSSEDTLYTHLYIGSEVSCMIGSREVHISLQTCYPWEGNVRITVDVSEASRFSYALRIPGWCRSYRLLVNGLETAAPVRDGYAVLDREWRGGEVISLDFDMPVDCMECNPLVRENRGKAAVMRGPLVYCLEEADNGSALCTLSLGTEINASVQHEAALLGGIRTINIEGKRSKPWNEGLYRPIGDSPAEPATLCLIPYYAWANRSAGEMTVWINRSQEGFCDEPSAPADRE